MSLPWDESERPAGPAPDPGREYSAEELARTTGPWAPSASPTAAVTGHHTLEDSYEERELVEPLARLGFY